MVASSASICARNTHASCAEARLIECAKRIARRKGGGAAITAARVRRMLSTVRIERVRVDGTFGRSLPCTKCRAALEKLDVCVECVADPEEGWITHKASALPPSTLVIDW